MCVRGVNVKKVTNTLVAFYFLLIGLIVCKLTYEEIDLVDFISN